MRTSCATSSTSFSQWRERKEPESRPQSPCLKKTSLVNLLCQFNGGCTPETLHCEMRKKSAENLRFIQQLSGMTDEDVAAAGIGQRILMDGCTPMNNKGLITNHLHKFQMEIYPCKLTNAGADRVFALRGYLQVTIRQYFYVRHRVNLYLPRLPLLCVFGGKNHQFFYPLECIDVVMQEEK
ncbi:PAZ domain-containing protein [Meloidogyne graminicola]|uniref:PAZ domain-containing protein n=1 Tax=Meloidogyne graminicola TaxID=189291 RepID=A0A8S9ZSS1_9BILA|nr:PAZ domain-containing protein [Meloidogyne graminicola]